MNRRVLYSNRLFQLMLFLSSLFGIFMRFSKQLIFDVIADSATEDLSAPLTCNIYRKNVASIFRFLFVEENSTHSPFMSRAIRIKKRAFTQLFNLRTSDI